MDAELNDGCAGGLNAMWWWILHSVAVVVGFHHDSLAASGTEEELPPRNVYGRDFLTAGDTDRAYRYLTLAGGAVRKVFGGESKVAEKQESVGGAENKKNADFDVSALVLNSTSSSFILGW